MMLPNTYFGGLWTMLFLIIFNLNARKNSDVNLADVECDIQLLFKVTRTDLSTFLCEQECEHNVQKSGQLFQNTCPVICSGLLQMNKVGYAVWSAALSSGWSCDHDKDKLTIYLEGRQVKPDVEQVDERKEKPAEDHAEKPGEDHAEKSAEDHAENPGENRNGKPGEDHAGNGKGKPGEDRVGDGKVKLREDHIENHWEGHEEDGKDKPREDNEDHKENHGEGHIENGKGKPRKDHEENHVGGNVEDGKGKPRENNYEKNWESQVEEGKRKHEKDHVKDRIENPGDVHVHDKKDTHEEERAKDRKEAPGEKENAHEPCESLEQCNAKEDTIGETCTKKDKNEPKTGTHN